MNRWRHLLYGVVAVLGGCSTSGPVPEDRFYQLDAPPPARVLASPLLNGGLTVERVLADPMRSGRAILYRQNGKPLELRRYHYEFWVDEPPEMIRRALVRYLDRSGIADAVDDGNVRTATDYSLQARLQRFEQLVGAAPFGVEVEIELTLYSRSSHAVVWRKLYSERQDVRDSDMHTVARAMQSAVDSIFHAMTTDIVSLGASL